MAGTNERKLGDLIKEFIRNHRLEDKITETRIMSSWEKVMGSSIALYTDHISIRKRTLIVKLRSSVLRNELHYAKKKIIRMINEELGTEAIDEVDFR
ncbi:MAG: DUF721 domain-containing protein [Bacteroidia bacterium]|nr:MAG: DUF721 domain-containing protein [Bacteroidia bacterium]